MPTIPDSTFGQCARHSVVAVVGCPVIHLSPYRILRSLNHCLTRGSGRHSRCPGRRLAWRSRRAESAKIGSASRSRLVAEIPQITRPAGTFEWVKEHRKLYLLSGGAHGHIMDLTGAGGHSFGTHCMIRYRGRKSGRTMINALCYGDIGGEVVICASKGGADDSPQWYHNILASQKVDFQIATQAFRASWREPKGAERE